jgi:hypothetical protein
MADEGIIDPGGNDALTAAGRSARDKALQGLGPPGATDRWGRGRSGFEALAELARRLLRRRPRRGEPEAERTEREAVEQGLRARPPGEEGLERTAEHEAERSADHAPERTADQDTDRGADQNDAHRDRNADHAPDQGVERGADQNPDRGVERGADQNLDRARDQNPDRRTGRDSDTPGTEPGRVGDQRPGQRIGDQRAEARGRPGSLRGEPQAPTGLGRGGERAEPASRRPQKAVRQGRRRGM